MSLIVNRLYAWVGILNVVLVGFAASLEYASSDLALHKVDKVDILNIDVTGSLNATTHGVDGNSNGIGVMDESTVERRGRVNGVNGPSSPPPTSRVAVKI